MTSRSEKFRNNSTPEYITKFIDSISGEIFADSENHDEIYDEVAQYILLFHLQARSLEGLSAKAIAKLVPYSYGSTTLGITCMEDLGLCEKVLTDQRTKQIHFTKRGLELWKKAEAFFISPLDQRIYCNALHSEKAFPVCGVNALAHYTWLNSGPEKMFMLTNKEYRTLKEYRVIAPQHL